VTAPGSGLLEALRRLDVLLSSAVDVAAEAFGPDAAADPYRGLVIGPDEVARLLQRDPGAPILTAGRLPDGGHGATLDRLADEFDLRGFDLDLLMVAAAPEIDLRYERLVGYLHDDVSRRRPSVDLALHLLCADAAERIAARSRVAPDAPLIRHGLLHLITDPTQPHQPLLAQGLRVDGQVLRLLLGESTVDPRLVNCARVACRGRPLDELPLDPLTRAALPLPGLLQAGVEPPPRLYLHGPPGIGQLGAAQALAAIAGRELLVVDLARVAEADEPIEEIVRTAWRDAWFRDMAILVEGLDAQTGDRLRDAVTAEVARSRVLTFLTGRDPWIPAVRDGDPPTGVVSVPFPLPAAPIRLQAWREALDGSADGPVLEALAGQYRLDGPHIREAAATARHRGGWTGAVPTPADLFAAARAQSGRELTALACKIDHMHGWDDLVLPEDTRTQLTELASRVRQRTRVLDEWGFDRLLALGRGTCALFAGPSGTGKTMAADVIAGELGLDLYAIDLATVVSKYIGETEKNLKRIFDAARRANAVLFFDEADAIFGKRSEVRDAHDRYANIEIAYLLQKMEEHDGIAILATNLRENLDDAFLRRLHFVVEFPVPDEADRERMWRRFIPPRAPVDAIDFAFLARQFRLPGGNIKNIVVSAAYLASANGGRIGMPHLIRAVWREHQKIGRVLSVGDAGDYACVLGRGE
jgi:SpoVK/Ycf46/Vps4 family AAA+-type ATPase